MVADDQPITDTEGGNGNFRNACFFRGLALLFGGFTFGLSLEALICGRPPVFFVATLVCAGAALGFAGVRFWFITRRIAEQPPAAARAAAGVGE